MPYTLFIMFSILDIASGLHFISVLDDLCSRTYSINFFYVIHTNHVLTINVAPNIYTL
jgi:hypothetical protein